MNKLFKLFEVAKLSDEQMDYLLDKVIYTEQALDHFLQLVQNDMGKAIASLRNALPASAPKVAPIVPRGGLFEQIISPCRRAVLRFM